MNTVPMASQAAHVLLFWSQECNESVSIRGMIDQYQMAITAVSVDDPQIRAQLMDSRLVQMVPTLLIVYPTGQRQRVEGVTQVTRWMSEVVQRMYASEDAQHRKGEQPRGGDGTGTIEAGATSTPEAQAVGSTLRFEQHKTIAPESSAGREPLASAADRDRGGGVIGLAQKLAARGRQDLQFE